jgi:signal transduction histidine kinase
MAGENMKTKATFIPAARESREEILILNARLRQQADLAPLLDAMPDAVILLNRHRQIVFGNAVFSSMAEGRGCPDYAGLRPGEFFVCEHLADASEGCGSAEQCSTCGAAWTLLEAADGERRTAECRLLARGSDGIEALDVLLTCTLIQWQHEQLFLLVIKDISDQKRLLFLERIFLHDILNTVSAISSMTELMAQDRLPLADMKHDLVEMAHSLIDEITTHRQLMAAEANELTVEQMLLAPRLVLEQAAATCRNLEAGRDKEIFLDIPPDNLLFISDESLLYRVLVNLGKNALEATSAGGRVTLGCRREGEHLVFWCHNPGVMPRETQLQIFHRSFSTKGEGRGIGTYSVKLLTERYLKGEVSFVSREETGTRFSVAIPFTGP